MKNSGYIRTYLVLLLLGISYFIVTLYQNNQRTSSTFNLVNHTHEVIKALDDLGAQVLDFESQVRGYVITDNSVFLEDLDSQSIMLANRLTYLKNLTADNPVQQKNLVRLQQVATKKIQFQQEIRSVYPRSRQEALQLIGGLRGKALSDTLRVLLQQMEQHEQQLLHMRIIANRQTTKTRNMSSVIAVALSFLMVVLVLLKVMRENKLRRIAEQKSKESEWRYRGLIENSAVVMYRARLDGSIDYISNKCYMLTGYEPIEFSGRPLFFLVQDEWKEKVRQFYHRQIQQKTYETLYEFPIQTKEGAIRWIEQSMVLLEDNGKPLGFQGIVKDITEKKEAEAALKAAEDEIRIRQEEYQFRLQAILDNIPMTVCIKDLGGRFVMVNRRFSETFALTDAAVVGKLNQELFANEHMNDVFAAVEKQVKTTLMVAEAEGMVDTCEGERHMLITKFPLFDKDNNFFAICGINKDITEMVRSRQQLIDARLRAEKAERLQEEFLANMSHEIRTPMNGIIGMTDLLSDSALSSEQRDFVQLIKQSSNTLLAIINDILDLSKIKAGRMTFETIDFDVHEVVEEVVAAFRLKAAEKGVGIEKDIASGLPPAVKGDRYKLTQVLNNLVSNAVKFTAQGSVTVSVHSVVQNSGEISLRFAVADTGIGIAPRHLDYIFESFAQTGNDMMRRYGGTGLGLAITKRLVELQGGKIGVQSVPEQGSVFCFDITYRQVGDLPKQVTMPLAAQDEKQCLAGKKILLVEDNPINQKVTKMILQKAGLDVAVAENGKEAVDWIEGGAIYDVIIMDLQMPEMNGIQAAAYIRNKLKLSVPIIAMTASALRNEKKRCLEVGMNAYLTKPFVPADLFRHLRHLLHPGAVAASYLPAATEPNVKDLYNLALLKELEDDIFLAETLELFIENTPRLLEDISSGVLYEQWDEVHAKAHKLKGSIGLLQIHHMIEPLGKIEKLAKHKQDLVNISPMVTELVQEYELVQPMLKADLDKVRRALTGPIHN